MGRPTATKMGRPCNATGQVCMDSYVSVRPCGRAGQGHRRRVPNGFRHTKVCERFGPRIGMSQKAPCRQCQGYWRQMTTRWIARSWRPKCHRTFVEAPKACDPCFAPMAAITMEPSDSVVRVNASRLRQHSCPKYYGARHVALQGFSLPGLLRPCPCPQLSSLLAPGQWPIPIPQTVWPPVPAQGAGLRPDGN